MSRTISITDFGISIRDVEDRHLSINFERANVVIRFGLTDLYLKPTEARHIANRLNKMADKCDIELDGMKQ